MTLIELIATLFGLACVGLTIRQNIWCWPTGLVQVVLYIWIFQNAKLYSDMILHVIYVGLQFYGWYHWLKGGPRDNNLPIGRMKARQAVLWLTAAAIGTTAIGFAMRRFTDAALPFWDAAIMILSLIAQYLLARKTLENWLFWIAVDVLAIGVYLAKTLYITTGLYAVFLVLATMGWFTWLRSYKATRLAAAGVSSSESSCPQPAGTSS